MDDLQYKQLLETLKRIAEAQERTAEAVHAALAQLRGSSRRESDTK